MFVVGCCCRKMKQIQVKLVESHQKLVEIAIFNLFFVINKRRLTTSPKFVLHISTFYDSENAKIKIKLNYIFMYLFKIVQKKEAEGSNDDVVNR